MCILGRDWALIIPKLARTLHNMSKTVQEMSDNIREKFNEFLTILRAKVNGQEIKLKLCEDPKSPICGEIMFAVKQNPQYEAELNPSSMIAVLEPEEITEPQQMTEVRARLEKELESCSAKTWN